MTESAQAHSETTGFKPVLCGYIEEALSMIQPGKLPGQIVVHDVRVLMKKSRAAIKLIGRSMDEQSFRREYNAFRETGRMMSTWRESTVHRKLLRDFRKRHPVLYSRVREETPVKQILMKHEDRSLAASDIKNDLIRIRDMLHRSFYRIRFMSIRDIDSELLRTGLQRSFQLVADCYLQARHNPKDSCIHEFRKKTKDLLYQLFFFRQSNPAPVRNLEKRLDSLAQDLGKYNDYAVLLEAIGYKYRSGSESPAMDEFAVLMRKEQDRYLARIWPAAYRIFKPGRVLTDIKGFGSQDGTETVRGNKQI